MRPAPPVRIKDPVAVNDFVIFVLEQGKIEFPGKPLLEFLNELLGVIVAVDADRQDLDRFLFFLGE